MTRFSGLTRPTRRLATVVVAVLCVVALGGAPAGAAGPTTNAGTYTGCQGMPAVTDAYGDTAHYMPWFYGSGTIQVHQTTCSGPEGRGVYIRWFADRATMYNCGSFRLKVGRIQPYTTDWVDLCNYGGNWGLVASGDWSGRYISLQSAINPQDRAGLLYSTGRIYYANMIT